MILFRGSSKKKRYFDSFGKVAVTCAVLFRISEIFYVLLKIIKCYFLSWNFYTKDVLKFFFHEWKRLNKIHNSTFRIKIQNLCLEHNFPNDTEKLPRYIWHLLFHRIWKSVLSWISLTYSTILRIPLLESTFSGIRQVTCYAFWIINCLKFCNFFVCLLG